MHRQTKEVDKERRDTESKSFGQSAWANSHMRPKLIVPAQASDAAATPHRLALDFLHQGASFTTISSGFDRAFIACVLGKPKSAKALESSAAPADGRHTGGDGGRGRATMSLIVLPRTRELVTM